MKISVITILFSFAVFCSCEHGSDLSDGLVAHYPLNGNAHDITGLNGDGTIYGASPVEDRDGKPDKAFHFDGVTSYIELPLKRIAFLSTYSYSVWIKAEGVPTNYSGMIYSVGDAITGSSQTLVYQPTSTYFAGSYNCCKNPLQSYSRSDVICPDQWMHIVVTRDTNIIRMSINSSVIPPVERSYVQGQYAPYGENGIRAVIGGRCNLSPDSFFTGVIDELRVYNRVVSDEEIHCLFLLGTD